MLRKMFEKEIDPKTAASQPATRLYVLKSGRNITKRDECQEPESSIRIVRSSSVLPFTYM